MGAWPCRSHETGGGPADGEWWGDCIPSRSKPAQVRWRAGPAHPGPGCAQAAESGRTGHPACAGWWTDDHQNGPLRAKDYGAHRPPDHQNGGSFLQKGYQDHPADGENCPADGQDRPEIRPGHRKGHPAGRTDRTCHGKSGGGHRQGHGESHRGGDKSGHCGHAGVQCYNKGALNWNRALKKYRFT